MYYRRSIKGPTRKSRGTRFIFDGDAKLPSDFDVVYKIPYRRAHAWSIGCIGFVQPLGRVRARAKESCIQILMTFCRTKATRVVYI